MLKSYGVGWWWPMRFQCQPKFFLKFIEYNWKFLSTFLAFISYYEMYGGGGGGQVKVPEVGDTAPPGLLTVSLSVVRSPSFQTCIRRQTPKNVNSQLTNQNNAVSKEYESQRLMQMLVVNVKVSGYCVHKIYQEGFQPARITFVGTTFAKHLSL